MGVERNGIDLSHLTDAPIEFRVAWDIAGYILSRTAEFFEDRRHEPPFSPHDCADEWAQTERGLVLQTHLDVPNRLWTPWGRWQFGGSSGWRGVERVSLYRHLFEPENLAAEQFAPLNIRPGFSAHDTRHYRCLSWRGECLPIFKLAEGLTKEERRQAPKEWTALAEKYGLPCRLSGGTP